MNKRGKDYQDVSSASNSPSQTSFTDHQQLSLTNNGRSSAMTKILKCSGVLIVLIVLAFLTQGGQTQVQRLDEQSLNARRTGPFKFRVYCPASYFEDYLFRQGIQFLQSQVQNLVTNDRGEFRRLIQENPFLRRYRYGPYELTEATINDPRFDPSRLYIISITTVKGQDGTSSARYCSLVRNWNATCQEAELLCLSPGAMFDFQVMKHEDVIWINQLDPNNIPTNITGCLSFPDSPACKIKSKINPDDTFYDPTNLSATILGADGFEEVQITPNRWPSVTHIHGLEVRPNFDGNPQTWMGNDGTKGIGFMDLENTCYFQNFETTDKDNGSYQPPNFYKFKDPIINQVAKSNRYPNTQNPGNLWYHDHAMRLTEYNAGSGLTGVYIIRDPEAQKLLPRGKYEKFIMKTRQSWENQEEITFEAGKYYRYRILNNGFGDPIYGRFIDATLDCQDPNSEAIPYYIIGADSSLFNETIYYDSKDMVRLDTAERLEVVIKFQKNFKICHRSQAFEAAIDPSKPLQNGSFQFSVLPASADNETDAQTDPDYPPNFNPLTLNLSKYAPFVYLNETELNKVVVSKTRMRPLMIELSPQGPPHFKINGHYAFGRGHSQNPQIGTTEDWWLINLSFRQHPIHVHLINFQVIDYVSLRAFPTQSGFPCPLYAAQFYLEALKHHRKVDLAFQADLKVLHDHFASLSDPYNQFCQFYTGASLAFNNKTYTDYLYAIEEAAYFVNVEDEFDQNNLSGIDLLKSISGLNDSSKYDAFLSKSTCPQQNASLYYCEFKNDEIPEWYHRWKDTASIPVLGAYRYRLRWTKSSYDYNSPEDEFFHVPIDQIREFPGYVYHCHILFHQDHEMMRSIMMQPPASANLTSTDFDCDQFEWFEKAKCLNEKCGNFEGLKQFLNVLANILTGDIIVVPLDTAVIEPAFVEPNTPEIVETDPQPSQETGTNNGGSYSSNIQQSP